MRLPAAFVLAALLALSACGGSSTSADAGADTPPLADVDALQDGGADLPVPDQAEPSDAGPDGDTTDTAETVDVCPSSACTVPGVTRCQDPRVWTTCADSNDDGCLEWGAPSPCAEGLTCSGGVCSATCTSECTFAGDVRCEGNATTTCGDVDDDGCLEWGTPVPCATGLFCSKGVCRVECQPECDPVGATTCVGNAVATCGDPAANGCLRWGTPVACGTGQTCDQGTCADVTAPGGVRLNEVYYDGPAGDVDAFIELVGPAGTSLEGFHLAAIDGANGAVVFDLALGGGLPPDGFFLVVRDTAAADWLALADQVSADVDPPNGPDSVQLRFGAVIVDALAYGTFGPGTFPAGEGQPARDVAGVSLGRHPDGHDTNANAADWSPQAPTPGSPNAAPDLCYDVSCETPPPAICHDASTLRVFLPPGSCSEGQCLYPDFDDVPCTGGCADGACQGQVPEAAGDVLITEIMPKATGGGTDTGEWFELLNPTGQPLDLAGCVLADADPPGVPLTEALVIPAGGYVVLAVSGDPAENFGLLDPFVYEGFNLSNSGEPLSITCGGVLIDRVSWTANMVHEGVAIQLSNDRLDAGANDAMAAWCDATASYGSLGKKGTPGAANGTCAPVVTAVTPDEPGQLVITELMAKAQAGGGDKGEWFELYNASGQALDLNGCWLADKTPEQYQFVEPVVLPKGGYLVLALSGDPAVNFGLPAPFVYTGFNLSNEGEALSLTCGDTVIDAIAFTVDWVHEGVAHQLSATKLSASANDLAGSWCPATSAYGAAGKLGTPGAGNKACP